MSSYRQWAASFARNGPARVTWVCGAERVLAGEVATATVDAIGPDYTEVYAAGADRETDIWEAALTSLSVMTRAVVVRNASALRQWRHLHAWLRERPRHIYLVFEDTGTDFPKDADGKLTEPATWIRDSSLGQLVRCTPLDMEDAAEWACRRLPGLTEAQARHLLHRASGDLAEVSNVLAKVRLFGGGITDGALDLLCTEMPGDFADRLIVGDRKGAMFSASGMTETDLGYSIGLLSSRLGTLSALHRAARDNMSRRDVTAKLGVPAFLAQKYAGVAKDYGEERVARCWAALAAAEDAYRSGTPEGAAEVLAVSW